MESFSKKAYNIILNDHKIPTKIEIQRSATVMRPIWQKITQYDLSPEVRDFWWQTAHGVINTKERLTKFKILQNDRCLRCDLFQETTEHCLFTCPTNKPALNALYALTSNIEDNSPKIT
jgi:hypothetical protein